ncbi:hypothetical protein [Streptomyces sp. NPDC057381]|uniref:hypothetical protein n=1 Tax=unclassified Streptomyces TaxID=2593676 RepID=UPI00363C2B0C
MSQRGRHARAVTLLRCALAMVTVVVAVLCVAGAGRSPASGAAEESAVAGSPSAVAVLAVGRAPGDEASPAAPRPCEKKGLAEQSSTRGDLRVPEAPTAGAADSAAQRGTAPSPPVRATAGPAPPASCAIGTSTTVLRI